MVASWSCCDIGHEVPEMDGNALLTGGVLIGVRFSSPNPNTMLLELIPESPFSILAARVTRKGTFMKYFIVRILAVLGVVWIAISLIPYILPYVAVAAIVWAGILAWKAFSPKS